MLKKVKLKKRYYPHSGNNGKFLLD